MNINITELFLTLNSTQTDLAAFRLQVSNQDFETDTSLDATWVLLTGFNILIMQSGFTMLEVGATQAKSVKVVGFKALLDHSIGALAWILIGWGLFKRPTPTFFNHPQSEEVHIMQQYRFAATAVTIVSGAVLSRCRIEVYSLFALVTCAITYPLLGHWNWNGVLNDWGVIDLAGGLTVHTFGGSTALIGAWLCGQRAGRVREARDLKLSFNDLHQPLPDLENESNCCMRFFNRLTRRTVPQFRNMPGHSSSLVVLGVLLLYVAWFSFNSGSSAGIATAKSRAIASRAAINTSLSTGASTTFGFLYAKILGRPQDITFVGNCALVGLVAATAGSGAMENWGGALIGILAVPVMDFLSWFICYVLLVDDPLDATAVHLGGGIVSVLWVGFADVQTGLLYGHGGDQLFKQFVAILVSIAWGISTAFCFFAPFKYFDKLTYSADAQTVGLDLYYFGGTSYPDFDSESVREYNATRRFEEQRKNEALEAKDRRRSAMRSMGKRHGSKLSDRSPRDDSRRGSEDSETGLPGTSTISAWLTKSLSFSNREISRQPSTVLTITESNMDVAIDGDSKNSEDAGGRDGDGLA